MSKRAVVLASLLLPATAHADTRPIDLDTAIKTALGQNDTVLGEAVDVEVAAADAAALEGLDDAVIEGSVGGVTRRTEPVDGPFFQETAFDAIALSLGIWKPLSTGGRVGITLRDDVARSTVRISSGGMPFDIDTTIHGPRAEVVFVQPLLAGRGKRSAHAARRAAHAERDAQAAERTRAEAVLVHDVTVTYWELAYADREVAIEDAALALAHAQLDVTAARADVGKGSELERLAVEQAIAAHEAARLAAEQLASEKALELRVLMAAEDGDPRSFAASEPLDGAVPAISTDDALARAVAYSPDLHVIAEHTRAAAISRDVAEQDLLPHLDLVLRGGPSGNSDQVGDAWSQLGTFGSFEAAATLTFSMPLGNHAAEARRDGARLREARLGHAADEVRGELTAAVQKALDAIALSERRIAAAAKAVELATRNIELERDRWKSGAGTNFDVLARQDQLVAAEGALARARADQRIAIAGLAYLTGE